MSVRPLPGTPAIESTRSRPRRRLRPGYLPAALLGFAVLGLAAPAGAATPAGQIVVTSSHIDHSYSCGSGDSVLVKGHTDDLMFSATCSTLTVSGASNDITLNEVSTITLTGSFEYICWDKGTPKIHNKGSHNVYAKCHAKTAAPR
jgi:uncharacterized protein (DUF2345 family)